MSETTGNPLYAAEKFSLAVYALATGAGPVKDRLHAAFIEICPIRERDVPDELREDYRWIRAELTKRDARGRALVEGAVVDRTEGRLGATLQTMRKAKAVSIAERICAVAARLDTLTGGVA